MINKNLLVAVVVLISLNCGEAPREEKQPAEMTKLVSLDWKSLSAVNGKRVVVRGVADTSQKSGALLVSGHDAIPVADFDAWPSELEGKFLEVEARVGFYKAPEPEDPSVVRAEIGDHFYLKDCRWTVGKSFE